MFTIWGLRLAYLLATIVLGVKDTWASNACLPESIRPAWQHCYDQYNISAVDEKSQRQMCSSVDCLVQCKKDAVGDCEKREEFREHLMEFDTQKWKVYFRFKCAYIDMLPFAAACEVKRVCPSQVAYTFNPAIKDKKTLCRMYANMRECVSLGPKGNCTADAASFHEEIRKLGYSISICDNTDIKHLYQKYGGQLKCSTNSGEVPTVASLPYVISLIFSFYVSMFF